MTSALREKPDGLVAAPHLNQSLQPHLVCLHLLLSGLVPLQLPQDVAGVAVRLVLGHFELLLHPEEQLVRVSEEILQRWSNIWSPGIRRKAGL